MEFGNISEQVSATVTVLAFIAVVWEYRHQIRQRRLELAQEISHKLEEDETLLFAVTCLDWAAGTIPIPDRWRAVIDRSEISPNIGLLRVALEPGIANTLQLPSALDSKICLLLRHSFVSLFNQLERLEQLHRCRAVDLEDLSAFGWIAAQLTDWEYIDADERPVFFMNAIISWYKCNDLNRFIYELARQFRNRGTSY